MSDLEAARERRRVFELGKRTADAHIASLRHDRQRWRLEAEFWKAEYDALLKEFCEFSLEAEEIIKEYAAKVKP